MNRKPYHIIALEDESSLLATFLGPNGRDCYTRMPFRVSPGGESTNVANTSSWMGFKVSLTLLMISAYLGCGDTKEEANIDHDRLKGASF